MEKFNLFLGGQAYIFCESERECYYFLESVFNKIEFMHEYNTVQKMFSFVSEYNKNGQRTCFYISKGVLRFMIFNTSIDYEKTPVFLLEEVFHELNKYAEPYKKEIKKVKPIYLGTI